MIFTVIRVNATIEESWVVGAPELSDDPNVLTCRRTPFGELEVPSSAIAGALRHHLSHRLASRPETGRDASVSLTDLMGGEPPQFAERGSALSPSALRVLGTRLDMADTTEYRTTTAIDPRRGAARTRTLRTAELAQAGAELEIFLRLDPIGDAERNEEAREELLRHLSDWTFFVGRGRTSGRGATIVRSVHWGEVDLSTASGLGTWMSAGGPDLVRSLATNRVQARQSDQATDRESNRFDMRIEFVARDAVLTRGDRPPGTRANSHHARQVGGRFMTPGTSLKGVVRARAGYIVRTLGLLDEDGCCTTDGCNQNTCPLCFLFGSTERRGHVRVHDAILDTSTTVTRTHVAIDRISGGAAEHRLYTEESLPFRPRMELRIDKADSATASPEWVTTLLNAVVLDMHDGYATIGARGGTGLGHMELSDANEAASLREHLRQHDLVTQITTWQSGQRGNSTPDGEQDSA